MRNTSSSVLPIPENAFFEQAVFDQELSQGLLELARLSLELLDLVRGGLTRRVAGEPFLARLQELLRPTVVQVLIDPFLAAHLSNAVLAAQAFQHDADLLFSGMMPACGSANIPGAFIDATYQFSGELASPNNPFADANGNIFVTPGKQIPGIPRHSVKGGVDYWVTPELKLGTDVIWVSSQWFIGDDANQNPKLADYWVANLHGSYQLTKEWQIYGVINNLFNRKFATVGTFFDTQSTVAIAIPNVLTDPRMVTPAQPLSVYVGMRAKL